MAIPTTYAPYPDLPVVAADVHELLKERKAQLRHTAYDIGAAYGIIVDPVVGTGTLPEELDRLFEQYDADLLIMGMSGASLTRKILGSNTISVLQRARYPVLVVPAESKYKKIEKILFACDYNEIATYNRLSFLKELALSYHASIQILHINHIHGLSLVGEAVSTYKPVKLEKLLRGIKHSYNEIPHKDIVEGIEEGVKNYDADLLIMVPRKSDFWDRLWGRSTTREMALLAHIPLLTLPNPIE
jgi:nucleotide-binding universal stress UspA family protein